MPMEIDPNNAGRSRRFFLRAGAVTWASAGFIPSPVRAVQTSLFLRERLRLAVAWDEAQGHRVGLLFPELSGRLSIDSSLEVPTRAHGLLAEPGGTLLAVARRPGDWLLRWHPRNGSTQWAWSEAGRSFNGHVVASMRTAASPHWVFTTETDLDSGMGLVGVRDAGSLDKLREWPTQGMDPHELLLDDRGLWVANGGIPTQPETGRIKRDLHRMDSSLVCLDPVSGELRGQWRLPDPRLSLRHMARLDGGLMGFALQAEHDDPAARSAAPVLAVFNGKKLWAEPLPEGLSLQGYGGDIAAWPVDGKGEGFLISAPRAHCVVHWQADGSWQTWARLEQACALIGGTRRNDTWSLGQAAGFSSQVGQRPRTSHWSLTESVRLDNHAVMM
jgi:uncharacterized protein